MCTVRGNKFTSLLPALRGPAELPVRGKKGVEPGAVHPVRVVLDQVLAVVDAGGYSQGELRPRTGHAPRLPHSCDTIHSQRSEAVRWTYVHSPAFSTTQAWVCFQAEVLLLVYGAYDVAPGVEAVPVPAQARVLHRAVGEHRLELAQGAGLVTLVELSWPEDLPGGVLAVEQAVLQRHHLPGSPAQHSV